MANINQITQLYSQYLGFTPSQEDIKRFSMMSVADTEDILRNTKSDVQAGAANTARSAIASLGGGMAPGPAKSYLEQVAGGFQTLQETLGIPEAGKRLEESEAFLRGIQMKGPMFEEVMRSGLQEVSPTFLGATRRSMEEYLSGIPNPFVRDRMIDSYLNAADRSMAANLNALNGLYQTSLLGAQTAVEADRAHYNKIGDTVKLLYSELQWINRSRYQEQEDIRTEEELKKKGLGRYYEEPTPRITGEEGEPSPKMRGMATRYLAAIPEEQDRYVPTAPYEQADFWNEVDWLQAQQGDLVEGKNIVNIQNEALNDIGAGFTVEQVLGAYPELDQEWIKQQYKQETGKGILGTMWGGIQAIGEFMTQDIGKTIPPHLR